MEQVDEGSLGARAVRGGVGGVLMGLANLVPGISGGTMLVASGIYGRFIDAVADVTRFRFSVDAFVTLAIVVGSALAAIVLLAGVVLGLVVDHRWVMYSLFIGLTLGGVPVVGRMAQPINRRVHAGAVAGFVLMAALAILQANGEGAGGGEIGIGLYFAAGVAGAGAMILPGVSGGYLLLVLGAYLPLLDSIDRFKEAGRAGDMGLVTEIGLQVITPVAAGVVVGVAVVSNGLKYLMHHFEKATLGVLLGLLFGAVVGLWPFQHGVKPEVGDEVKGRVMTEELIAKLAPKEYPTEFFRPEWWQVAVAILLIAAGFAATSMIAKLAPDKADG
ncbi:MAG: undecaprenyl phosphate translocase family protein [Planctomycetota bacterium]|jgi:putative membrane protein